MNCDGKRIKIKFEENARCATVMRNFTGIMRHAVLSCMKWRTARGNISCRDDVKVVLVGYKICVDISRGMNKKNKRIYVGRLTRRNYRVVERFLGRKDQKRTQ